MFEIFDSDAPELLLNKVRTLEDFTTGVRMLTVGNFVEARDWFARVLERSSNDRTAAYFFEWSLALAEAAPSAQWDGRIRMDVK